jgi:hypothetical protein
MERKAWKKLSFQWNSIFQFIFSFFLIPLIYFILILRTEISKICHIYESTFDFFSSLFLVFISITYVSSHIAFLSCLPYSFLFIYTFYPSEANVVIIFLRDWKIHSSKIEFEKVICDV